MIARPQITPFPEKLYVGIDVAKKAHVAAFVSSSLLKQHKHFQACPTLAFENNRAGFESLLSAMQSHAPLSLCTVGLERTGHYYLALKQFLEKQGVEVYEMHLQKRPTRSKSDKRDAQALSNLLYNQVHLDAQPESSAQIVRRIGAPSKTALLLRGLIHHRIELVQEATQRRNKLTSIADQLFPEASEVIKDLNGETALRIREKYNSAAEIAAAPIEDLLSCRAGTRPGRRDIERLKEVAAQSIGLTDPVRVEILNFEKRQLITELRQTKSHIEALDTRIEAIIASSREGQILTSIPMLSAVMAASIIASIGTIANFESASKLRGYFGWAPNQNQTGSSFDSMTLTKGGNRVMKRNMYIVGWIAVRTDTEWRRLYERLVPVACRWDSRTQSYKGKNKVLGRIIGQIIGLIWHLLRADYEMQTRLKEGEPLPTPILYNREVHRRHMRQ